MTEQQQLMGFLKRLGLYGSIFFAILSFFYLTNAILVKSNPFKAETQIKTLICGPSILRSSVDPSLIPLSQNISQDQELYPMTYLKLKYILKYNPQIEQIILAYSPGMISKKIENLAFQNPVFEKEIVQRLYPVSGPKDFEFWPIDQKILKQVFFQKLALPNTEYYRHVLSRSMGHASKIRLPYIGEFRSKKKSKLNESQSRVLDRLKPQTAEENEISPFLIQGLEDIIQLCEENDKELILFGPPVHRSVRELLPKSVGLKFIELSKTMESRNIPLLDLTEANIPDDYFFNASHINYAGSQYVTQALKEWLMDQNVLD